MMWLTGRDLLFWEKANTYNHKRVFGQVTLQSQITASLALKGIKLCSAKNNKDGETMFFTALGYK